MPPPPQPSTSPDISGRLAAIAAASAPAMSRRRSHRWPDLDLAAHGGQVRASRAPANAADRGAGAACWSAPNSRSGCAPRPRSRLVGTDHQALLPPWTGVALRARQLLEPGRPLRAPASGSPRPGHTWRSGGELASRHDRPRPISTSAPAVPGADEDSGRLSLDLLIESAVRPAPACRGRAPTWGARLQAVIGAARSARHRRRTTAGCLPQRRFHVPQGTAQPGLPSCGRSSQRRIARQRSRPPTGPNRAIMGPPNALMRRISPPLLYQLPDRSVLLLPATRGRRDGRDGRRGTPITIHGQHPRGRGRGTLTDGGQRPPHRRHRSRPPRGETATPPLRAWGHRHAARPARHGAPVAAYVAAIAWAMRVDRHISPAEDHPCRLPHFLAPLREELPSFDSASRSRPRSAPWSLGTARNRSAPRSRRIGVEVSRTNTIRSRATIQFLLRQHGCWDRPRSASRPTCARSRSRLRDPRDRPRENAERRENTRPVTRIAVGKRGTRSVCNRSDQRDREDDPQQRQQCPEQAKELDRPLDPRGRMIMLRIRHPSR